MKFLRRKTPKVGLALGSGAARGLAHIGVLKALQEASIPVDMIAGTSMGAMVGACFAKDGNIAAMERAALQANRRQLARLLDPKLTSLKKGLIHGAKIEELLLSLIGHTEFKDLRIPFAAIATDVNTGEEIVITEGSVVEAVRASISIPGIFVPVEAQGKLLVDGGINNPVPASVLKDMGIEFIIAVNVLPRPQGNNLAGILQKDRSPGTPSIFNTLARSIYIMEDEIIRLRMPKADVIITPDVRHVEAFEFHRSKTAIQAGYKATRDVLPRLQTLIGRQ